MAEPRYTFIWWGDGYFVYDGDTYMGKDDQVDPIRMMVDSSLARKIDYEDKDPEWGCDSLRAFFEEYGERS